MPPVGFIFKVKHPWMVMKYLKLIYTTNLHSYHTSNVKAAMKQKNVRLLVAIVDAQFG
jgi:hypothetical protein